MMYLRDVGRDIGEVVSAGDGHAVVCLLLCCARVVDDLVASGVDGICFEVCHRNDIGMCGCAVIAFVVVVGKDLPVVVTLHLPGMVELVVGEVELLVSFLLVDTIEVVFPGDLRLGAAVEVDPDEVVDIDMDMNG